MTKRKYPSKIKKTGPKKSMKGIAGRKLFDGRNEQEVIDKLSEVWQLDGSDYEAALWAGIEPATLSRYLAKNPKIAQRRDRLKIRPVMRARQTVVDDLNNPFGARWYLEKKNKNEFGAELKVETNATIFYQVYLPNPDGGEALEENQVTVIDE